TRWMRCSFMYAIHSLIRSNEYAGPWAPNTIGSSCAAGPKRNLCISSRLALALSIVPFGQLPLLCCRHNFPPHLGHRSTRSRWLILGRAEAAALLHRARQTVSSLASIGAPLPTPPR